MSGIISFGGLMSGLDTASIVSKLVQIKRRPIERFEAQKEDIALRLKIYDKLAGLMKELGSAAKALDSRREAVGFAVTSSDEEAFRASADSLAAPGSHSLRIERLARAQRDVFLGVDDLEADLGPGTFTLTVGGESHELTLEAGASSLSDLKLAVNEAGLGVNATIIDDGGASPYRLVLSAEETGTDHAFHLDTSSLSGPVQLALDTSTAAEDALFQLDGVSITHGRNEVEGVLQGVTLELRSVTAETDPDLALGIEADHEALRGRLDDLVAAYNGIVGLLNDQSGEHATLNGSSLIRSVQSRLSRLLVEGVDTGRGIRLLAEAGLELRSDGTLEVDVEKRDGALAEDFEGVVRLLVGRDGVEGMAARLAATVDGFTDFSSGLLNSSKKILQDQIATIDDRIAREERSIESYQEVLNRKFSAMEQNLARLQSQSNYLNYFGF